MRIPASWLWRARFFQAPFVDMVAADDIAARVYRKAIGRKDVLPAQWVLTQSIPAPRWRTWAPGRRVREADGAIAFGQVIVVHPFHNPKMVLKGRDQTSRKDRHPISFSLAIADEDLMLGKV